MSEYQTVSSLLFFLEKGFGDKFDRCTGPNRNNLKM